ncbi:MAG: TiaS agmantine-binding domain-containing protein, partial [Candidatus Poseidoniaceae archaeon]
SFLCRDDRLGTSMLAPRGASPVLFGIRTWTQDAANEALKLLLDAPGTEETSGSLVFETNHATNDHLDE